VNSDNSYNGWDLIDVFIAVSSFSWQKMGIKIYPCNRLWRPIELWEVEAPTFCLDSSQMAVRLWALRAGCPYPQENIPVHNSVRRWVDPRAIVRLERLGKLKNPPHWDSGSATFRLATYCLNQLGYRDPPQKIGITFKILYCSFPASCYRSFLTIVKVLYFHTSIVELCRDVGILRNWKSLSMYIINCRILQDRLGSYFLPNFIAGNLVIFETGNLETGN
jgi:hypothetical protein